MRIKKRESVSLSASLPLFTIPTITYLLQKFAGFIKPELEWMWWVSISVAFTTWILINFKIQYNGNN